MKKLLKAFKKLPPEMRMMLGMMGLASPVGAIYFLRRFFPGVSYFVLILYVAGAIVGICLLVFLISLFFKRGGKKRSKKMAEDLASDTAAGPAGMDVSAAIKANNEKFFNAVREMRKEVGVSVYDLPWYIVMGDSGCGKTYLVNNAGLTFSRGKPEGYQLGTLNYNWWFTEDAVFVDMAGRLCNPQDDADRREWEAFLNTIAKGRKGFPINGAVVCVSAEHLLQDPPEKHEVDANIALERLRDLQSKLGVTFATYLVVTKCDKILGFMQFFDRADRDITVKNQIFGWSKPGDFNELRDPERFDEDFGLVYSRLNDLRLRRLNDDADEIDLGLACSFPEEYRRLFDPLQTYVRTLFPMIKNPRAVKNLLFRGIYFTSATQEGGLILKHFKERLGEEAADQFAPLDSLFPNKRPHFIKDVLFKKVFPEHGLVFRNEQQVLRNRKLSKVLNIATVVLAVLLFGMFWVSYQKFDGLIMEPRKHAERAATTPAVLTPDRALEHAARLGADIENLRANYGVARVLSVGFGTGEPINHLGAMRVKLIEAAMEKALVEVDEALRSGRAFQSGRSDRADAYLAALKQYILWLGCMEKREAPAQLAYESFATLCGVVGDPKSVAVRDSLLDQAAWYFSSVHTDDRLRRNPASLLGRGVGNPGDTVLVALDHAYKHLLRYATFDADHPDGVVHEWMRIRAQCEQINDSYRQMLAAAQDAEEIETQEGMRDFKEQFIAQFERFDQALDNATWRVGEAGTASMTIPLFKSQIKKQREVWRRYEGELRTAADTCGITDERITASIASIVVSDRSLGRLGLDEALWRNLSSLGIVRGPYRTNVYDEEGLLEQLVIEVYESYSDILVFVKGDGLAAPDRLESTPDAQVVRQHLRTISDSLAKADFEVPEDLSDETAEGWIEALDRHLDLLDAEVETVQVAELSLFWRSDDLGALYGGYQSLIQLGEGTRLLKTILRRLEEVQAGKWGFAELVSYEDRAAEQSSPYNIDTPRRPALDRQRRVDGEPIDAKEPKRSRRARRRARDAFGQPSDRGERPSSSGGARVSTGRSSGAVPACATHGFLNAQAENLADLLDLLRQMRGAFLRDINQPVPLDDLCIEALEKSGRVYMKTYVDEWGRAYSDKKLRELERLDRRASSWAQLASPLESGSDRRGIGRYDIAQEFDEALFWILQALPWATYHPEGGSWGLLDHPGWREVASWMFESIDESWDTGKLGDFVLVRKGPVGGYDSRRLPWETITDAFKLAWLELAGGIGSAANLPNTFDEEQKEPIASIPWGELQKLRDLYGLDDEDKVTGALVRFEERAQELFSVDLTRILYGRQRSYFKQGKPFDGWPYLEGDGYSASGLDTVDFQSFKAFLVEMHRARREFKELEDRLPDDAPGRRARKTLYAQCEEWFSFLGLEDDLKSGTADLRIAVRGADATEEPFGREQVEDTAQHTADYFVLDLGLALSDKDRAGGEGALRISTVTEYKKKTREVRWIWTGTGREVQVRLEEIKGRLEGPAERVLGQSSPLALCAYLHRHGMSFDDPRVWYVTHAFERSTRAGGRDAAGEGPWGTREKVGEKLVFTLDRGLPDPIPRLREVKASRRSGR